MSVLVKGALFFGGWDRAPDAWKLPYIYICLYIYICFLFSKLYVIPEGPRYIPRCENPPYGF